ncbi:MAG: hypothetical protein ACMUJI_03445 [Erythrobacter sp.]|uniref:hypothetical protein n=1 Tax=Erythrobacter sp. TaxID=1042 RepID=UPI003A85A5E3
MTFVATITSALRTTMGAVAQDVPVNEFGVWDGHPTPWWETALLLLVTGLMALPVALMIAWLLFRLRFQNIIVTASLAAAGALAVFLMVRAYNMANIAKQDALIPDDPQFRLMLVTMFVVSLIGSMVFMTWLKRKQELALSEIDPGIFE